MDRPLGDVAIGASPATSVRRCENCLITIRRDAEGTVERDGLLYCCDGCADGGPCTC